jgi:hypothetical protein
MKILKTAFFAVFTAVLLSANVGAYIDPSTTAMLTQIIAGAVISLGLVFGIFRQRIIMFFKNMRVNRLQRKIEKDNK